MRSIRRYLGLAGLSLILQAQQWQPLGPFGGTALTVSTDPSRPGRLMAGAQNSLVFRSTDGGASWTRVPFPRHFRGDIRTIWIDPARPDHLLVGVSLTGSTSAGVYESKDDGTSWRQVPELAGLATEHVTSHPANPRRIAAATRRGVFLSTDGGATWNRATPESNEELHATTAVAFDPAGDDVIYSGTTHLPWRSVDGGVSWRRISRGMLDDSDVFSLTVGKESPKQLFLSACSGMYTSADGGESWRRFKGLPMTHRRTHILRQDPSRPATLYAGTTMGLFKSDDAGLTWRESNKFLVKSLAFDPVDSQIVYLATDGAGVQKSTDGGKTWAGANRGFVSRRASDVTFVKAQIRVRTPEGTFAGDAAGQTWTKLATVRPAAKSNRAGVVPAHTHQVASAGPQVRLAAGGGGLWNSSDGGLTWNKCAGIEDASVSGVAFHPGDRSRAYAIQFGRLYQSNDGGRTWSALQAVLRDAEVDQLWMSQHFPDRLFASTSDSGLYFLDLSGVSPNPIGTGQ